MEFVSEDDVKEYFNECIKEALRSTCLRSKCGSIIVKDGEIIGVGFNSPPGNLESQRKCLVDKEKYNPKVTDKTCCVHAEQRAIIDSTTKNPTKLKGAIIYFIRLDKNNKPMKSKEPYCTHCSKLALDAGTKEFILWREEGICSYNTEEYNLLSFDYGKQ